MRAFKIRDNSTCFLQIMLDARATTQALQEQLAQHQKTWPKPASEQESIVIKRVRQALGFGNIEYRPKPYRAPLPCVEAFVPDF